MNTPCPQVVLCHASKLSPVRGCERYCTHTLCNVIRCSASLSHTLCLSNYSARTHLFESSSTVKERSFCSLVFNMGLRCKTLNLLYKSAGFGKCRLLCAFLECLSYEIICQSTECHFLSLCLCCNNVSMTGLIQVINCVLSLQENCTLEALCIQ